MQSLRRFRDYSRQILSLIQLVMLRSGVVRGYSAQAPFPQAPGFAPVPSIAEFVTSDPTCTFQIIGGSARPVTTIAAVGITTTTSSGNPVANASISCTSQAGAAQPIVYGGSSLSSFSSNFTGVDYRVDNSIPGGSIRLSNQTLHIADSNFSGLTPYAQATLILQDSQVSMRRTSFVGNIQSVAGGIYADSSTLELDSCVFRNNFGYQGGAISLTGSSSLLIANTTEFTNNTGQQGGALSVTAGSAVVQNSIFNQNNCTSGGAVYLDHVPVAAFSDSSFTSNVATSNGGGIFSNDAGLLELSSCSFSNNKGQTGGAVSANLGDAVAFFDCTFTNNTASQGGGAILATNVTSAQVSSCTFSSNKAQKGGGLLINACNGDVLDSNFTSNTASQNGGGSFRSSGSGHIARCSFTKNKSSGQGGAVYEQAMEQAAVLNSTFSGNTASGSGNNASGGSVSGGNGIYVFRSDSEMVSGNKGLSSGDIVQTDN